MSSQVKNEPSHAPVPSRSSQAVAMIRSQLSRPHTPDGDPDAQTALCEGMRTRRLESHQVHIAARTRFFDRQVLAALGRGVRQIVILGAGYDDRGLRFRSPGVHYFELDHPDTQSDKRARIDRMRANPTGLTLAPADFRYDKVADVLDRVGHDRGEATLFICEGLLVYLDQDATVGLLGGLRSRANGASSLAASLSVHPDGADTAAVLARANAARPNSVNEPWRTILPAAGQRDLLARSGWIVAEAFDDHDFDPAGSVGRSLFAVARPDGRDGD
jgi:methyltransferase (TIGR00027 family)